MEGRGTKRQRRKKKVYVKPYNNTLNFNLFSIIIVSALGEGRSLRNVKTLNLGFAHVHALVACQQQLCRVKVNL